MTTPSPLPTAWNLYNLVGSPYFQETLETGDSSPRPLSLFVGRDTELRQMRDTIYGAGESSSRQAVAGVPGVGKTTLVQELKRAVLAEGYLTTDALVPILAGDTSENVFGRVLGALYETILVNRPHTVENKAMQDAQLVVRADRLASGGASFSVAGFGGGVTRGTTVVAPKDLMIDGPRIMRDLMALVRQSGARGVLLHLNNLENLSESQTANAAEVLRSLRDPMLLHNGLHYVVVGTTDAVNTVVNTHVQVRTIFSVRLLEPLALADVHRMLVARYEHLRLDEERSAVPPADDDAVAKLYELFRGDLRGLLKALDDGVTPLLGLVGTDASPSGQAQEGPVRPLTIGELRPMLQRRYATHLWSLPEQVRVEQLSRWGKQAPESSQTQRSLMKLWNVTQGAVSNAVSYLVRQGFVVALPRNGAGPIHYVLSGVSRIIFG
jgi:hypothetical protein